MITLALELSSPRGSLALLRDAAVAAEETWVEPNARSLRLFHALPNLFRRAGIAPADVDQFVVGRGPGSYSGLRTAVTTAQGLALPGGRPVYAVSSGAALARTVAAETGAAHVAVAGDARRGTLWIGVFRAGTSALAPVSDWIVVKPEDLAKHLPADCLLVSPDWNRLGAQLKPLAPASARWIEEERTPDARSVAALAFERIAAGLPSEPPTPIYMHPAVEPPAAG